LYVAFLRYFRASLIVANAMADQIMAADKARLKKQLAVLSKADMLAVEEAILMHLVFRFNPASK
jgi:mRNA-degrading endonuclease toxin of MazEF toxin-antitoxin module